MRRVLVLAVLAASAPTLRTEAQQVKQFKDWLVSCDNLRTCSAFGFENKDDPSGAYVLITRAGTADADPVVVFRYAVADEVKTPYLKLSLAGQEAGGVPTGPLPGLRGEARLGGNQVNDFLSSLHTAKGLTIALMDGSKPLESRDVSLAGSTAALRFMDAEQKRVGGVTALVAKGPAPPGDIPPVPPPSVVAAQPISQFTAPLPRTPAGVRPSEDCLTGPGAEKALIAFRLSPALTLWGACDSWGAYNEDYRFFVVGPGKTTAMTISGYDIPGQKSRPNTRGILTNPNLSDDKTTLTSIEKDEGLGDCGIASNWVWDGQALRLVELRAMPVCRGVNAGDWPLVFTARKQ